MWEIMFKGHIPDHLTCKITKNPTFYPPYLLNKVNNI